MFTQFHWPSQVFDSSIITRALRAIDISVPRIPKSKEIFSIQDLTNLIHLTLAHPWGLVLRPLFVLAFFAFLRISNLLPQSAHHYDSHYTLLWRDVAFKDNMTTITLRYTKSRQSRSTLTHLQVPTFAGSPLCPVQALKALLHTYHLSPQFPLFTMMDSAGPRTLTQAHARLLLAQLCTQLNLPYQALGFHAFCCSEVFFSFLPQGGSWAPAASWHLVFICNLSLLI